MQVTNVSRGRTVKTATVEDIVHETDAEIVAAACAAAGETESSLFGWRIEWRQGAKATVALYTD